ncbi:MAG TPA: flagellin [Sphingomonas sp.]|jgi:flagellar hook-associated protein 3 FlgL|uniref:flagellin N-terminal helical domain-containing protein n=1 Tax=Sphingomonas sp. TaxID=28214 RepID=UPI002EDB8732
MQVPTTLFYDGLSKRMSGLNARATELQTQIATGKKLKAPSDDAVASQQLAEFKRRDADAGVYGRNMTVAGALLKQTDSTLDAITLQIQRAIVLTTQAGNGTLTPESRAVIGTELAAIVDQLVELGNSKDIRGEPLFGSADGTKAVQRAPDGSFSFVATKVSDIPVGDGQTVQATESASRVFEFGGTNILAVLSTLATALQSGTGGAGVASDALDELNAADDQVNLVRTSVGARAARIELGQAVLVETNTDREELRSALEDTDVTAAITELQKTLTVLQATQASFTKMTSLSLFNYLR